MLSYLPRTRCRHEYVTITPDGYRFRGQMFSRVTDLFRWFKEHFRDPIPGQSTPGTPHGAMTSKTPYNDTPGINGKLFNTVMPFLQRLLFYYNNLLYNAGVNPDAIQRVAQNMPHHMLHSLTKVASQTPHHYTPYTPGAASVNNYGMYGSTPYTPSGQTPFMTPYHTPHHTPHHPQTPSHVQGPFLQPIPPAMNSNAHRPPRTHRPVPAEADTTNWMKAAEAWARSKQSTSKDL